MIANTEDKMIAYLALYLTLCSLLTLFSRTLHRTKKPTYTQPRFIASHPFNK